MSPKHYAFDHVVDVLLEFKRVIHESVRPEFKAISYLPCTATRRGTRRCYTAPVLMLSVFQCHIIP